MKSEISQGEAIRIIDERLQRPFPEYLKRLGKAIKKDAVLKLAIFSFMLLMTCIIGCISNIHANPTTFFLPNGELITGHASNLVYHGVPLQKITDSFWVSLTVPFINASDALYVFFIFFLFSYVSMLVILRSLKPISEILGERPTDAEIRKKAIDAWEQSGELPARRRLEIPKRTGHVF